MRNIIESSSVVKFPFRGIVSPLFFCRKIVHFESARSCVFNLHQAQHLKNFAFNVTKAMPSLTNKDGLGDFNKFTAIIKTKISPRLILFK